LRRRVVSFSSSVGDARPDLVAASLLAASAYDQDDLQGPSRQVVIQVTIASGRSRYVKARKVRNKRLADALSLGVEVGRGLICRIPHPCG
jgi:hypothetical protein